MEMNIITVDPFASEVESLVPEHWGYTFSDEGLYDEVILDDEYEESIIDEAVAFADALSITYTVQD
tara:strand:- start:448 stop:645 length:198 start_codon:yes stop_codon:yes gene_type:complete